MQEFYLDGKKFGRLTVMSRVQTEGKPYKYRCKCDCGGEKIVSDSNLISLYTKSCGCLVRERSERMKKKWGSFYGRDKQTEETEGG